LTLLRRIAEAGSRCRLVQRSRSALCKKPLPRRVRKHPPATTSPPGGWSELRLGDDTTTPGLHPMARPMERAKRHSSEPEKSSRQPGLSASTQTKSGWYPMLARDHRDIAGHVPGLSRRATGTDRRDIGVLSPVGRAPPVPTCSRAPDNPAWWLLRQTLLCPGQQRSASAGRTGSSAA